MSEIQTGMRYEELKGSILTPSIDLAQVGKPPHVPDPNRKANACQQVLDLVVPFGSLLCSRILCFPHPWIMQINPPNKTKARSSCVNPGFIPSSRWFWFGPEFSHAQSEAVLSEWCPELHSLSFIWLSSNGTTTPDSRATAFYWVFLFVFFYGEIRLQTGSESTQHEWFSGVASLRVQNGSVPS